VHALGHQEIVLGAGDDVEAPRYRMRVVDSGCLCGHVHEEIASSLIDLYVKRERDPKLDFDCVLIEMSGLADPVPVIQALLTDRHVSPLYELKTVIGVTDGVHGVEYLARHPESVKQAALVDTIVISKTDVADADALDALAARLTTINPGARQMRVAHGAVLATDILDHAGFDIGGRSAAVRLYLPPGSSCGAGLSGIGDLAFSTFALTYDEEITLPGFVLWINLLAGFRGAGLLRVKGIVNVEGKPYVVQAVQTIISEPEPLEAWPEGDDRRSRLVFITHGIDAADIERTFSAFRFEGGRGRRNMTINPETYARFRETIELFRTSPRRGTTKISSEFKNELETQ